MNLDERIKYAAMKERHKKKLRPWYRKPHGIILIILGIIILLIFIAYFILPLIEYTKKNSQDIENSYNQETAQLFLEAVNRYNPNSLGDKDAPVKIIEFGDFACPYCADSYASLKNVREKYKDDIYVVYRDFPLHDTSVFLSLSARCAGEQGKFWLMHDLFFENQDSFTVSESDLIANMPDIALALNLDESRFTDCVNNQKYFPQIQKDVEDAEYLGIQGTPTWYINNMPLTGSLSVAELEEIVEGIIAEHKMQEYLKNNTQE
ncbi:MAG: thioredoxin domain-containing protein [Patescibacteria group bacterium]|nr:thioredoxin domain-containing protein [Patescibacteria group bacterium]